MRDEVVNRGIFGDVFEVFDAEGESRFTFLLGFVATVPILVVIRAITWSVPHVFVSLMYQDISSPLLSFFLELYLLIQHVQEAFQAGGVLRGFPFISPRW